MCLFSSVFLQYLCYFLCGLVPIYGLSGLGHISKRTLMWSLSQCLELANRWVNGY